MSALSAALVTVATYRGTALGWQPIGLPRPVASATALVALVNRIRPDHITRIKEAHCPLP
jgi:hypothetical protein